MNSASTIIYIYIIKYIHVWYCGWTDWFFLILPQSTRFGPFLLITSLGHLKLAGRTCDDVWFVYRSLSVDLPVEVCSRAAATAVTRHNNNKKKSTCFTKTFTTRTHYFRSNKPTISLSTRMSLQRASKYSFAAHSLRMPCMPCNWRWRHVFRLRHGGSGILTAETWLDTSLPQC